MSKLVRACAASLSALLLGASFTASASATSPSLVSELKTETETVRVTGLIQQLVIDNIAHDVDSVSAHSHGPSMITYIMVGDQRIKLDQNNSDLAQLSAGSEVVLDLAVDSAAVPSGAVGTHNELSASVAEDLALDLTAPTAADVVEVISQPDIATTETSGIRHNSVVVLPVPSDYVGDSGDCTVDWAQCTLPQVADWQTTNGPLSVARATQMMAANEAYWVSQSRGALSAITSSQVVHVKVPVTSHDLCFGDPDVLMRSYWVDLADDFAVGTDDGASRNSLVVFSGACTSPTDGFAYIGGHGLESSSITQIRNDNDPTLIHEFGHMFSLGHSNLEIVDGPLAATQTTPIDYFGMYSPMQLTLMNRSTQRAYTAPALDGAYEILLGLDKAGESLAIEEPGEYILTQRTGSTGVRTMYINDSEGYSHIIEFRSGTGQDAGTFYSASMLLEDNGTQFAFTPGIRVYTVSSNRDGSNIETFTTSRYDSKTRTYLTSFGAGNSLALFDSIRLNVLSIDGPQARIEIVDTADTEITSSSVTGSVKSAIDVPFTVESSSRNFTGTVSAILDDTVLSELDVTGVDGLAAGKIRIPSSLPAGTHPITLVFGDSPTIEGAQTSVSVSVKKRSLSSLTLSVPTSTYGKSTKATVTAKGSLTPSGTVKFYVDGKYYKSASIKSGKATVTLSSTLKAGKHSIKASFPSSSVYNSKSVSTALTVKKLKGVISGSPTGTKYVKVGSSYSKKVTLNATGKLQRRVDGEWRSIKTLSKGTSTVKFSVGKTTKAQKYRVIVSSTSNVTGTAAKSFIIRPKR